MLTIYVGAGICLAALCIWFVMFLSEMANQLDSNTRYNDRLTDRYYELRNQIKDLEERLNK